MLTPAFELSQSKDYLTVVIRAPFAKIAETEIFIEENDFKFFSKPYFLRLNLPGNIVEDGREKADYDGDKGIFTITVPKETAGEHFEGLDMLTKLLAPKGNTIAVPPLIQVIGNETNVDSEGCNEAPSDGDACDNEDGDTEASEEYDWSIEQTPYTEQPLTIGAPKYGFANQKSGVFDRLQEELCRVVDCPDPDRITQAERREARVEMEQSKFDADHYLADLYEDEVIQTLLAYEPPWIEEYNTIQKGTPVEQAVELTEEEQYLMRKLPKKEYLLDLAEENMAYFGLIDIIYAYCYNHRTSEGENNVESGWTISKLSATLSWLEVFSNVQEVLDSCFCRSLCFPLYRHWELNLAVLQDVIHIFKIGRRRLLKCLLEVYTLLLDQDTRYVLNDLYITDYCVWLQSASPGKIKSLAEALTTVKVSKSNAIFDLDELEKVTETAIDEYSDGLTEVTEQLAEIKVNDKAKNKGEQADSDGSLSDNDVTSDSDDVTTDSDDITSNSSDCVTSDIDNAADTKNSILETAKSGKSHDVCDCGIISVDDVGQKKGPLIQEMKTDIVKQEETEKR